jgi:hypothetical protein
MGVHRRPFGQASAFADVAKVTRFRMKSRRVVAMNICTVGLGTAIAGDSGT